jgi:type VI secretion system protein VasG
MEISRQHLFGRLNDRLLKSIEGATTFCRLRGNPYVELVHWLHQLLSEEDNDFIRIVHAKHIDRTRLTEDILRCLSLLPAGATSISDIAIHVESAVERAWTYASLVEGDDRIRSAHLIHAMMRTPDLKRHLCGISMAFDRLSGVDLSVQALFNVLDGSPEGHPVVEDTGQPRTGAKEDALTTYCRDLTQLARNGQLDPVVGREHEIRTLTDILLRRRQNNPLLTGEAGVGKTAVVEGLAQAIASGEVPHSLRDVRLLNLDVGALLAGASMKGEFEARLKALLEEAAVSAQPVILFIDEMHVLVGAGGQAGTADAANLLKPALARGALRTIGATTWSEYKRHIERDAALTRRFQVLQVIEPDEANAVVMVRGLVRSFESHHGVMIRDDAVRAAVRLSHRYIPARQLPDKAISLLDTACARVALSQHAIPPRAAYLREREQALVTELALLDKEHLIGLRQAADVDAQRTALAAVQAELADVHAQWQAEVTQVDALVQQRRDVLEAADSPDNGAGLQAAQAALSAAQGDTPLVFADVGEAVVADIVSDWTGIPVGRMLADEVSTVMTLDAVLGRRVVGQDHGLACIAERIQTARAHLSDPRKPVGVFLLTGPSGVGKTETALALAQALYGGEHNLITVNLSEFQESHTISTLKGAPPGYVGYGEGGVLTEAVRRRPYSVVLLDEVEKAHPDVHELFYQVFDKGYMEDGEGRHVDFRHTVLILTSNVGAAQLTAVCQDPALVPDSNGLLDVVQPELAKVFPPAFLGRMTLVPYLPLTPALLGQIVAQHLDALVERMAAQHGVALTYAPEVLAHIVMRAQVAETGARQLIHVIESTVQPALARIWLGAIAHGPALAGIHITADTAAGGLHYASRFVPADEAVATAAVHSS